MTKIQLRFDLLKPLDDELMEKVARVHTVYGILRVAPNQTLDKLLVEYDATRLSPREVEMTLARVGLPIALHA